MTPRTTCNKKKKLVTFLVNFGVLISMNAALTAFLYDCTLLKVTLPDPIGYLCLSVSIPVIEKAIHVQVLFLNYKENWSRYIVTIPYFPTCNPHSKAILNLNHMLHLSSRRITQLWHQNICHIHFYFFSLTKMLADIHVWSGLEFLCIVHTLEGFRNNNFHFFLTLPMLTNY